MDVLHTILLGPYKYLLRSLMCRLSTAQKAEIEARISAFNFSGLDMKLGYNLCRHFKSYVGRDFKALAQVALFLLGPYMSAQEKSVWHLLSKVMDYLCYYIMFPFKTPILCYVYRYSNLHFVKNSNSLVPVSALTSVKNLLQLFTNIILSFVIK